MSTTEALQLSVTLTADNEYVRRMRAADNGLWDAMEAMRAGLSRGDRLYREYFTRITHGKKCPEERLAFWRAECQASQNIVGDKPPRLMLHSGMKSWKSMNLDHTKFRIGDVFCMDGNHRITAALVRGEEPTIAFAGGNLRLIPEWRAVLDARTDKTCRARYQPHPHPLLWDLRPYRTVESCDARYGAIAEAGIKSAHEIGCADGYGLWRLKQAGVVVSANEIVPHFKTLAESLLCQEIDGKATPENLPDAECLVVFSVFHHIGKAEADRAAWLAAFAKYRVVAIEIPSAREAHDVQADGGGTRAFIERYVTMSHWPNGKLVYTDPKHAGRETWLFWRPE